MSEADNSWLNAGRNALAPAEREALVDRAAGETVVDHLIRIARGSRRCGARRAAVGALLPAARDHVAGVVELALDLLHDPSRPVWYGACRALAVALVPSTLPALSKALAEKIDVPWEGLEGAIRAVRSGSRDAFHIHAGRTFWVLQDEQRDHAARAAKILGSSTCGTAAR